jgi:hypothetical protein
MALKSYFSTQGHDLAQEAICHLVPQSPKRSFLFALIAAIEEFRVEQPSLLESTFDLHFFSKVLIDSADNVSLAFHGRIEYWGVDPATAALEDSDEDVSQFGLRMKQASNFEARTTDPQVKAVLQVLISAARKLQMDGRLDSSGVAKQSHNPAFPFDFLFMAMAIEQGLRPGRPARDLIAVEVPNGIRSL